MTKEKNNPTYFLKKAEYFRQLADCNIVKDKSGNPCQKSDCYEICDHCCQYPCHCQFKNCLKCFQYPCNCNESDSDNSYSDSESDECSCDKCTDNINCPDLPDCCCANPGVNIPFLYCEDVCEFNRPCSVCLTDVCSCKKINQVSCCYFKLKPGIKRYFDPCTKHYFSINKIFEKISCGYVCNSNGETCCLVKIKPQFKRYFEKCRGRYLSIDSIFDKYCIHQKYC